MSTQPVTPQPATPTAAARKTFGLSRGALIGIGVGCGCLSVIVGIVVIMFIFAAIQSPSSQPAPAPRPQPPSAPATPQMQPGQPQQQPGQPQLQPGQPPQQPGQPEPQPSPVPPQAPPGTAEGEGPDDLKVTATLVKVQGQMPNAQPGEPADTFAVGEAAGATGLFVRVSGEQKVVTLWARIENGTPVLLGEPRLFSISERNQGARYLAMTNDLRAGEHGFGLGKLVGDQLQPILVRKFRVQ